MLKNFLKTTWRSLLRDSQFTLLNLIGLSTGLACTLLIYLWVSDELQFDKFHEKDSQLFQVMKNKQNPAGIETNESTPGLLANTLADEMPEVDKAVAVFPASIRTLDGIISVGNTNIKASAKFGSRDYFNIFSYDLMRGDKNRVLADKNAVVISSALALKLFPTVEEAIGKSIKWDQEQFEGDFFVSGIYKEAPANSSIQFDMLFSYDLFLDEFPSFKDWSNGGPATYLLLKNGTNVTQFNYKIAGILTLKDKQSIASLFIRKYSDQYLYGNYENGVQSGGRITYVKLFSLIAFFILFIACINFMNLSTARAGKKIKDAGIRKAIGASRKMLILQYVGESMVMSFLSLAIAILLANILLPQFNFITGKQLTLNFHSNIIVPVLIITFVTAIISGSYPALYLSGFKAVKVLKGKINTFAGDTWPRKGLVVFQFSISAILIVSVLVLYRQTEFIHTRNLGFNKNNIIRFTKEGKLIEKDEAFLVAVKNLPGVVQVSTIGGLDIPGAGDFTSRMQWEGKAPDTKIGFGSIDVGYDLIDMFGYKIKEGRAFSRDFGSGNAEILFNETAIKSMGLTDPVGKIVKLKDKPYQIVGVVSDFHFESLYEKIKPCFFRLVPNARNIVVKIQSGKEKETITQLQQMYRQFNSGLSFDYKFLDQEYQALYISEERVAALSRYFAGLAILISCLGLFGLVAFTAERRLKEISIRKILGATVSHVVVMLSKDFFKLVLMAILITFPLSWWAMNKWLEGFAYRIHIGVDIFIIAGGSIILITLLTISFHAIKVALVNPVNSLRTE